jgi:hypothetical protein
MEQSEANHDVWRTGNSTEPIDSEQKERIEAGAGLRGGGCQWTAHAPGLPRAAWWSACRARCDVVVR